MYLSRQSLIALSSIFIFAALIWTLYRSSFTTQFRARTPIVLGESDFHALQANIWLDLDGIEFHDVLEFLFSKPNDLNLTRGLPTSTDNRIILIEALAPNKTAVLKYLEGSSQPPDRWARVTVSHAASEEAAIYDYMVGPLPVSDAHTRVVPLDYCYNSARNYVRNLTPDPVAMQEWLQAKADEMANITTDLLGSGLNRLDSTDPKPLTLLPRMVESHNWGLVLRLQLFGADWSSDEVSILGQGLYAKAEIRTRDISNWKISQWYYNDILYNSTEAFRAAWQSPNFERVSRNLGGEWTRPDDYGRGPPGREKPPPTMIQPLGPRYDVDSKQKFVSWMGFEFYFTFSQATGLSLFDIKFNDERIIYELGMQEALANYAGGDPSQSGLFFLDTFFGMGVRMFELVPGYDCPSYATYLDTTYHVGETSVITKNNICLFEYTADHALQRHTGKTSISISRNQYLILRTVSTVGNYDYTIDYLFYLDGSIEVKVRASGYISGAFYASTSSNKMTKANEYGYRVHDAASTSIHDHIINFKADLDIAGTANTLMRIGIEPTTVYYPWDEADMAPRNTMRLKNSPVIKETGLDWPRNSGEIYVVMNKNSVNTWGEKRGYRITPGTGMGTPPHLTALNATSLQKSAEWASKNLWVVKQKDTEPKSAHPLNWIAPEDPLIDFSKFVDGESIEQEDLIIYFNLGSHHIPHSGDIPNTLMHTSASSVMFTPHNFHDRDPSRKSAQGVRLDLAPGGPKIRYFGGRYEQGVCLNNTDLEPDLSAYSGTEPAVTDLTFNKSMIGL